MLNQGDGIAGFAHIGGFVFGALASGIVKLTGWEGKFLIPTVQAQVEVGDVRLSKAVELMDGGKLKQAVDLLVDVVKEKPSLCEAHYLLALAYEKLRDYERVRQYAGKALGVVLRDGRVEEVRMIRNRMRDDGLWGYASCEAKLKVARFLMRMGFLKEAEDVALEICERDGAVREESLRLLLALYEGMGNEFAADEIRCKLKGRKV